MKLFKTTFIFTFSLSLLGISSPYSFAADTQAAQEAQTYEWATKEQRPGLPNLHKVTSNFYRGAQPEKKGFKELNKMGIKTVISFRNHHSDKKKIGTLPLNYIEIPINTWQLSDKDVEQFVKLMADEENYPVFIHCQHGADRTGTMTAVYRMVFQGWPKEEAIKEMTQGGFGYHSIWKNLLTYLEKFDIEKFKQIYYEAENPKPAKEDFIQGNAGTQAGALIRKNIESIPLTADTIDFEALEKEGDKATKNGVINYHYEKELPDGTQIRITGDTKNGFVKTQTPPEPAFYVIYTKYSPSGLPKTMGKLSLDTNLKLGYWSHYNESGKRVSQTNEDYIYGAFTYYDMLVFLGKEGHINLETAEGRDSLNITFDKDTKQWTAKIQNGPSALKVYTIDGETGQVLNK